MSDKKKKSPAPASNRRPAGKAASNKRPGSAPVKKSPPQAPERVSLGDRIKNYNFRLRRQRYKYGTIATALTAAGIAAVVLLNVVAGMLTDKYRLKFDMTSEKRFEISADTKELLAGLEEDVGVYVFMTEEELRAEQYGNELAEVISNYGVYSSGKVSVQYIDPVRNPTFKNRFQSDITIESGTVVVERGDKSLAIPLDALYLWRDTDTKSGIAVEKKLSNAISNLFVESAARAAILSGHNEANMESVAGTLLDFGYEVRALNLMVDEIPDDISLIVMSMPSTDYTEDEISKLEKYLASHKNLIFMHGAQVKSLPQLELFFREWGVEFESSLICDAKYRILGYYPALLSFPASDSGEEPLLNGIGSGSLVVSTNSRPINTLWDQRNNVTVTELLISSDQSYAKPVTGDSGGVFETYEQADGDKVGPFTVAVMSSKLQSDAIGLNETPKYSNILFLSSPYVFLNDYVDTESYGNLRFAVNVFSYFNSEANLLSVRNKRFEDNVLDIYGNGLTVTLVLLCVIPAAVLALGIIVWYRRKNL